MEYNSGYNLLASVSEDVINYIADAIVTGEDNTQYKLRKEDGSPNIKSCMHVLGFNTRFQGSGEVVLSEEKEVRHRVPKVLVRHSVKMDSAQEVKLYAGKLREDYTPPEQFDMWLKNISFSEGIMHMVNCREVFSIEEFGNDI